MQNNFGLCSSPGQWPQGQADPHGGQVSGRCARTCVCVRMCESVSNGAINWPPRSIMRVPGLAPLGLQHTCIHTHTHTHILPTLIYAHKYTPTQADVLKHEKTKKTYQMLQHPFLCPLQRHKQTHCKHHIHCIRCKLKLIKGQNLIYLLY